eukprot:scpid34720/ scgid14937/ Putative nuclease HARBI1; Harbinger transposase-derived nuclease
MAAMFAGLSLLQQSSGREEGVSARSRLLQAHVHRPVRSVQSRYRSLRSHDSVNLQVSRRSSRHDVLLLLAAEDAASSMRRERRWWSIHHTGGQLGFWETKVKQWHRIADEFGMPGDADDYLDMRYLRTYRVDCRTFEFLLRQTCNDLQQESTRFRTPVPPAKRLAICMHWLAHGLTFDQLGELYCIGASTAHDIVHAAVSVFKNILVPAAIKFPSGRELEDVIAGFSDLAQLPMCAGAIDGTFVHIKKPALWGDNYWCYKNFIAIHMLAVCDHRCQFTFVDVGRAGCVGDAFSYAESSLRRRIVGGRWLQDLHRNFDGTTVRPYLIGDSAFPLEPQLMKCYDQARFQHQTRFNKALISSRQKIENAFGFYKGRWHVLIENFIRDPAFMRDVALVCAALHNICQRANCEYSTTWNADEANYIRIGPELPPAAPADLPGGGDVRFAISSML